jgi:pectate lyase
VFEVTNLNDAGTGSLRACVEAYGPRTCVFRVGGTIELRSELAVSNPFLTVAGQTAPGDGVLISGKAMNDNVVLISTHDVIWRYTRVRVGYHGDCGDRCISAIAIISSASVYNVVIDHNSISWNEDEGIGVWGNSTEPMYDITLSWNLLAEPLANHPTSLLIGAERRTFADAMTDVDIHHNLVISANHRNPLAKNKSMRLISNIFYNYDFYATQLGGGIKADIIGNYYHAGPDTGAVHEVQAFPRGNEESAHGTLSLYLAGNKGPNHNDPNSDNWSDMTSEVSGENGAEIGPLSEQSYRRGTPMAARHVAITIDHVDDLEGIVLPIVGASRRLDCGGKWVAGRDAVDLRLIDEYRTGTATGFGLADESAVGGFPNVAGGTPCADTDHDGMPDGWESRVGLDPSDPADRNGDRNGDGYTNLEEYLSGPE